MSIPRNIEIEMMSIPRNIEIEGANRCPVLWQMLKSEMRKRADRFSGAMHILL
jgi:hypothetical protein